MNVRLVTAGDADDLFARYDGSLARDDAQALCAAQTIVRSAPTRVPDATARALRAAGATLAEAGEATLVAISELILARVDPTGLDPQLHAALAAVLERARTPAPTLRWRERTFDLRDTAQIMGIVNVASGSFYSQVSGAAAAAETAATMAAAGATIIDLGGQSYADGVARIGADGERSRVVPAVRAIVEAVTNVALSIDTVDPVVADAALAAGAHAINDCSGLADPALAERVAAHDAGLVVMHIKGELRRRDPAAYRYRDAVAEIVDFLYERTERALAAGIARDAIVVDPGLEFGKEPETDLEILERFGELRALGYPMLLASSRKSFLRRIFGVPSSELLVPSLTTAAIGIAAGARLVRVHDVAETVTVARMMAAVTPRVRAELGTLLTPGAV
jgi:dihydropteroate synthase